MVKKIGLTLPDEIYEKCKKKVDEGVALSIPEFIRNITTDYFSRTKSQKAEAQP